jgi:protein O-mannosyl-transferase
MGKIKFDINKSENVACINWRVLVLFSILILGIYSNIFQAPFHLDDFHNITQKNRFHIDNLHPATIYEAVFKNPGKFFFYRPISNISIAVNWYFGKYDVFGYHTFNLAVHIIAAYFLFLTILLLFNTPNIAGRHNGNKYFIAILAACLWAINPIQTQAVTYIVQRMAAMAAMFYIIGIFCFLNARLSVFKKKRFLWFLGVLISFLLSIGSKENAIMLPVSLLLVEIIFFKDLSNPKVRNKTILFGLCVVIFVFVLGICLFLSNGFFDSILRGYDNRTFSFFERILTQPRIVTFYLSQIFYPISDRLSLDHDIVISTGLFSPWTTLPSLVFIIILICIAFWQIRKMPFLSFSILFFFVNHIIESSVIALELIFEHRNYLPSMFLFLPVAALLKWCIDYYMEKRRAKTMGVLVVSFTVVLIILLGFGTYIRNMAWSNEKILWEDTMTKAPGRARAYQALATRYYAKINDFDRALFLFEKARYLVDNTVNKAEIISLANMANIYEKQYGDYKKAIEFYDQILEISPTNQDIRLRLAISLLRLDKISEANENIGKLLSKEPHSAIFLNTKGLILLKENDPENALNFFKKSIKEEPDNTNLILNLGVANFMLKQHSLAEHYFKRAYSKSEGDITPLLFLIENSVRAGNFKKVDKFMEDLLSDFNLSEIQQALQKTKNRDYSWSISTHLIAPLIAQKISERSDFILGIKTTDNG